MNCRKVQRSLAAYRDALLARHEEQAVALHLAQCRECGARAERLASMRRALRALPPKSPPTHFSASLRVMASRELVARASNSAAGAWIERLFSRARFWANGMMRPFALPVAGGLLSAIVLFGVLMPSFAVREISAGADVPTGLSTEATVLRFGPFDLDEDDTILLDVTVDRDGRVVDYSTPGAPSWVKNPQTRRSVENMLLMTVFNPGTMFGQPSSGRVRIMLSRSEIDVRG